MNWKPDCSKLLHLFVFVVLLLVGLVMLIYPDLSLKANLRYSVEAKPSCQTGYSSACTKRVIANFTRNTQLFLSLNDIWWIQKNPAVNELPYGVKGSEQSINKILARIQYDMPENISSLVCKRCVIVGNGYTLRNSSLGETINEYDIVIRINDAPVRGYEKDVGSKTTLRFFYPESAAKDPNIENNPSTLLVFLPFKQVDAQWLREIVYDEKRKPVHPTTGLLAITVALNYCDEVHIAGFGYPLTKQSTPIHYYGKTTMKEMANSEHNVTHEQQFLKRLLDAGAIKYLTALE
ncbi:CMP-N-acetylneuraminate-beta-galactosamide-alpha-2,3-sialyltransferase 4 isoform X3 [Chiloscyllium punctatum]|uniref:CMP-N-acetylneuraminate-beta-galactosamide- alpha-2,3-sialyltransferase 4 isoform X3 n=1 Tax=Chiloscyllium punctatum TaxID=137246 RepID=UPI003B636548